MKIFKFGIPLIILVAMISCEEKRLVDYSDMYISNNLWYYKNELKPFSGTSYFNFFGDSSVVDYREGKWHGRFIIYFSNGNIDTERNYKLDMLHGRFFRGTKEGLPIVKGQYRNGKMHGTWQYYDANGNLKEKINY